MPGLDQMYEIVCEMFLVMNLVDEKWRYYLSMRDMYFAFVAVCWNNLSVGCVWDVFIL